MDYIKEIIESLELLETNTDKKEEFSVRSIKESIEQLDKVKELLVAFEKSQRKEIQTHTKEHARFLDEIDYENRKEIVSGISAVRRINSSLVAHNEITEKLEMLAYNLGLMKTTILTKDFKTTRRMMRKMLSEEDLGIKGVITHTSRFKQDVERLRSEYEKLVEKASAAGRGVDNVAAFAGKNAAISRLEALHEKQKNILVMISNEFANVSKRLLSDKEYKKFLRKK